MLAAGHKEGVPDGFTLVELLVVIAIVAILAALLLPTIARTKDAAKTAACKSNLHQIGLTLHCYVDDNAVYPSEEWEDRLFPVGGITNALLTCPALKHPQPALWPHNQSYGYNEVGIGLNGGDTTPSIGLFRVVPVKEDEVVSPSNMIAIADCMEAGADDGDIAAMLVSPDDYVGNRHNGRANVVFCDVHVESNTQTNWMKAEVAIRSRWNHDHQPHPEWWQ